MCWAFALFFGLLLLLFFRFFSLEFLFLGEVEGELEKVLGFFVVEVYVYFKGTLV